MKNILRLLFVSVSIFVLIFSNFSGYVSAHEKHTKESKIVSLDTQKLFFASDLLKLNSKILLPLEKTKTKGNAQLLVFESIFFSKGLDTHFNQNSFLHFHFLLKIRKTDLNFPFHSYW